MRGYPEDGCVVAVRGGRGERKQNTPVENGVTARSVGGLMRAINIEAAAQHRQGSTCKVVNEGGSSDWLNPKVRTGETTVLEGSNQLMSNYGLSQ